MRTFEAPAMGACLAMEDTEEHRADLRTRWRECGHLRSRVSCSGAQLLDSPETRRRLRENCHALISEGGHTYSDRLKQMLQLN